MLDCMLRAYISATLKAMGIQLPKQQCRPQYLICQCNLSRPAFIKSMTLQEKKSL